MSLECRWSGTGVALEWCWSSVGVALEWCWSGAGVALEWRWRALEWHWSGTGVALEWCWSGTEMALEWQNGILETFIYKHSLRSASSCQLWKRERLHFKTEVRNETEKREGLSEKLQGSVERRQMEENK